LTRARATTVLPRAVQAHPARACVLALIKHLSPKVEPTAAQERRRYLAVTAVFLVASYGVAMSVDDLSVVLEAVGATAGPIMGYLLPAAAYIVLHPGCHGPRKAIALLQFALGLVIMPVSIVAIFLK
jgi:amino acid permease